VNYYINETGAYHREDLETLGWELTVCNTLVDPGSPCRRFLKKNISFGEHLYAYLDSIVHFSEIRDVLEVGGGYGYLMRDFLSMNPALRAVMVDISPLLLGKQRETLNQFEVEFVENDFFLVNNEFLTGFQLAVLNENCGDFPTVVQVTRKDFLDDSEGCDTPVFRLHQHLQKYNLSVPAEGPFNYNLGAVEALEKLCGAGIPYIYMSEHSCEAETPEYLKGLVDIRSTGNPEKISLKGHDEYTIKFSHLERVAEWFGYGVKRGQFIDFIPPDVNGELRFILTSGSMKTDEHEIVRQFVEDLVKYEFLVLCRGDIVK